MIQIANKWLQLGVAPIPIRYRSKLPANKWSVYVDKLPTEQEIRKWFGPGNRNIAVVTGSNGLTVLDFDTFDGYYMYCMLCQHPETFTVLSNRGVHLYYFVDEATRSTKLPGLDIKGRWGYVLTPPSVHPSGKVYKVLENKPIARIQTLGDVIPPSMRDNGKSYSIPDPKPVIDDPYQAAMATTNGGFGDIKTRYKIEEFFPDRRRAGQGDRYWVARCPFHDDRNPSLWIDVETQVCGCYSCRMKAMDVINLYARLHGKSNEDAIKELGAGMK